MKETRSLRGQRSPHMERVYVKVNSDFDATGYMQPRSITWADGRTFQIEAVKDYRPAACYRQGAEGSCYTVMIKGQERHLFFEWTNSSFASRVARWYVEAATEAN
jgi:hypothetical protein